MELHIKSRILCSRQETSFNICELCSSTACRCPALIDFFILRLQNQATELSINKGQHNKHIPGTNEYKIASEAGFNKSILFVPAESLLPKLGTGQQVGNLPVGSPGSKERINYGQNIGNYIDPQTGVSAPTTNGIVHYRKNGVHIVPARLSEE
ncbi:polymorphic toxin type 50 domain-containing protein [Pantoea sp. Lij88]|uniref:polymorphic toxin type 50 domain-containing protein n=1 Tax=Pantoea sp. Lij88 TaxID=3028622 RepID=UPI0024B8AD84|nr:polymorphic toxin type 50 domain-containing protein [Pantoea sp. Lij88]WHQ76815.1 polymorphic toxin type 50 domain-containing protein [Pantoea sp. Lij88]